MVEAKSEEQSQEIDSLKSQVVAKQEALIKQLSLFEQSERSHAEAEGEWRTKCALLQQQLDSSRQTQHTSSKVSARYESS